MRGPCERCGDDDGQPLTRRTEGDYDRMECRRCARLEPPIRGCTRCGRVHMLQVTQSYVDELSEPVTVRLCLTCRRAASAENGAAVQRTRGTTP